MPAHGGVGLAPAAGRWGGTGTCVVVFVGGQASTSTSRVTAESAFTTDLPKTSVTCRGGTASPAHRQLSTSSNAESVAFMRLRALQGCGALQCVRGWGDALALRHETHRSPALFSWSLACTRCCNSSTRLRLEFMHHVVPVVHTYAGGRPHHGICCFTKRQAARTASTVACSSGEDKGRLKARGTSVRWPASEAAMATVSSSSSHGAALLCELFCSGSVSGLALKLRSATCESHTLTAALATGLPLPEVWRWPPQVHSLHAGPPEPPLLLRRP